MTDDSSAITIVGGGGVWGVAWKTGLAEGLADLGLDIRVSFDRSLCSFVGTSAGAIVSAQLTGNMSIDELFEHQVDFARQPRERISSPENIEAATQLLRRSWDDGQARLRATCKFAPSASRSAPRNAAGTSWSESVLTALLGRPTTSPSPRSICRHLNCRRSMPVQEARLSTP